MNYQKIYDDLINKAKSENRKKLKKNDPNYIYYEKHHIIPKCMGGNKDEENLVLLTAREHCIVHELLVFIYPKNKRLIYALYSMICIKNKNYYFSSREYQYAKELISKNSIYNIWIEKFGKEKADKLRDERIKKIKQSWYNKSEEEKQKINKKKARKGKTNGNFNTTTIIKDNIFKRIKKEELIYWLELGWAVGVLDSTKKKWEKTRKINNNTNLNKIIINNKENNKFIKEKDLKYWLSLGWILGGKNIKCSEKELKRRAIKENNPMFKKRFINNGIETKLIKIEELEYWLSLGWKMGSAKNFKKYITKDGENKIIKPAEFEYWLSLGWKAGRIMKKYNKRKV